MCLQLTKFKVLNYPLKANQFQSNLSEKNSSSNEVAICKCPSKQNFKKCCKMYRETPMLESLFNKIADLQRAVFKKTRLQHKLFSFKYGVNFFEPLFYRIPLDGCFWLQSKTKFFGYSRILAATIGIILLLFFKNLTSCTKGNFA